MRSSTRVIIGIGLILVAVGTITYLDRRQDGGAEPVGVVAAAECPVTVLRVEAEPLVESITHSDELRAPVVVFRLRSAGRHCPAIGLGRLPVSLDLISTLTADLGPRGMHVASRSPFCAPGKSM